MDILLFDMDSVLIEPHGYHRALQDTVLWAGRAIGFAKAVLTSDDIARFEAAGVSSEWDTSAICAAWMLLSAWSVDGARQLVGRFDPLPQKLDLPAPDFATLAHCLAMPQLASLSPLSRARRLFLGEDELTLAQRVIVEEMLAQARQPLAPTYQVFQELALGSNLFEKLYGLPPAFGSESYLAMYDRPMLNERETQMLQNWLGRKGHFASILTARPGESLPPVFSPPEAEIGVRILGLQAVPIASFGKLQWLAERLGADAQSFVKPSPVHALAALLLAIGVPSAESLQSAAALALEGKAGAAWKELDGARVVVFEDSVGGIESLRKACALLQRQGIVLEPEYLGVAHHPVKVETLKSAGARCFLTLSEALCHAEVLPC
ncbi:MAG: hypothetical protein HPY45_15975 [Anaerolineae bacterium]|nr:hypothetical protein [Anaerolineae bacterium]